MSRFSDLVRKCREGCFGGHRGHCESCSRNVSLKTAVTGHIKLVLCYLMRRSMKKYVTIGHHGQFF